MFTNAQVGLLFDAAERVINSSDDTGCTDDLTVVSADAISALQEVVERLKALDPKLMIGVHGRRRGNSVYAFVVEAGASFDSGDFRALLLSEGSFEMENEESAEVSPCPDEELSVIGPQSKSDVPRDEKGDPLRDPPIVVGSIHDPAKKEVWNISLNLTDRWGELNWFDHRNKPLGGLLDGEGPSELLERLREQMSDEMTFIVRKDGKYGILFEQEFCCQESDEPYDQRALLPRVELERQLREQMAPVAQAFPKVQFAFADPAHVVHDRSALWAFAEDGALNGEERAKLADAIYRVAT